MEKDISDKLFQEQINRFQQGGNFTKLLDPCSVGNGILKVDKARQEILINLHNKAQAQGRLSKFIPASGAASRMFKHLAPPSSKNDVPSEDHKNDLKLQEDLIRNLKFFPFYEELLSYKMDEKSQFYNLNLTDINQLREFLFSEKGLSYLNLPKGLIPFHRYEKSLKTPFEEHISEAIEYIMDDTETINIHFTVSKDHKSRIKQFITENLENYNRNIRFNITYSIQKPSTDTIAVDLDNRPIQNGDNLLFRPGGHGALIENLNDLKGDIVFLRNIDNISVKRIQPLRIKWEKILCGILLEIQEVIFNYSRKLKNSKLNIQDLREIYTFCYETLNIRFTKKWNDHSPEDMQTNLQEYLNKPIRVCGMVLNQGEPGGGPFWVRNSQQNCSIQIVDSTEVDLMKQKEIWDRSTHFNPVQIVCGVRNFLRKPFNLTQFVDSDKYQISIKSFKNQKIKALELPGLWNGSMSDWITILIEVPIETFNPVKTVNDLLRPEHQEQFDVR